QGRRRGQVALRRAHGARSEGGPPVADPAVNRRAQDGDLDLPRPEIFGGEADRDAHEGPDARVRGVELVAAEVDRAGRPVGVAGAVAPSLPRVAVSSGHQRVLLCWGGTNVATA